METTCHVYEVPAKYAKKRWFKAVKRIMRIAFKRPEFIFLGEEIQPGSIILSNHEGLKSPMSLELYGQFPVRFWGAHEMNTSLKPAYWYQTHIYYHEKHHWNLTVARLFCLIATPLTRMFYKGLRPISTYGDVRLKNTLNESVDTLRDGPCVVIFPEKSDKGYLKELEGFHSGAVMLFKYCQQHGINPKVYVSYMQKERGRYVFDAPVTVEELLALDLSREDLAQKLCARCNELGKMEF